MNFIITLILLVGIAMALEFTAVFASKLANKTINKRIKKLKQVNKRLIEQNTRFHNDYQSIYENMVCVNTRMRELHE